MLLQFRSSMDNNEGFDQVEFLTRQILSQNTQLNELSNLTNAINSNCYEINSILENSVESSIKSVESQLLLFANVISMMLSEKYEGKYLVIKNDDCKGRYIGKFIKIYKDNINIYGAEDYMILGTEGIISLREIFPDTKISTFDDEESAKLFADCAD